MVHPMPHSSQAAALTGCPHTKPLLLTAGLSNPAPSLILMLSGPSQACLHSHQQERDSSLIQTSPMNTYIPALIDVTGVVVWSLWHSPPMLELF